MVYLFPIKRELLKNKNDNQVKASWIENGPIIVCTQMILRDIPNPTANANFGMLV